MMDDISKLRLECNRLKNQLQKRQDCLKAYLRDKLPRETREGHGLKDSHGDTKNSQWSSTPVRDRFFTQSPLDHLYHKRPQFGSEENARDYSAVAAECGVGTRAGHGLSGKRKSDADTPRNVGFGPSLLQHGSESKRLRSSGRVRTKSSAGKGGKYEEMKNRREAKENVTFVSPSNTKAKSSEATFVSDSLKERRLQGQDKSDNSSYMKQLLSPGNNRIAAIKARDVTPKPRSILLTPGGRAKKTPMRVSFLERLNQGHHHSPIQQLPRSHLDGQMKPTSYLQGDLHERSYGNETQPLLGYDWIAGLLDTNPSVGEQSDVYLEEIKQFRRLNREECVHTAATEGHNMDDISACSTAADDELTAVQHKCIHNYVLNNRLFPEPLHGNGSGESVCAICQTRRNSEQNQQKSPSYIRVSVPRSTLMSPYQVRPHRRQSFDPTDSMGLSQHCLAGWQNSRPSMMPSASTIDLKASLDKTLLVASSLFDPSQSESQDTTAGHPLHHSRQTRELLNRSHALRADLQRLERAGLSMAPSGSTSYNNSLL
ncbi:uncharacterized protein [Diadema setosum]|uniref:uncharacterized protein n=1 Tax=Diadema setosum TaxID=31175 RepID=UPI003B3ACD48